MAYLTWNLRHDATNSPPGKRGLHRAPGPQRTHAVANAKVAIGETAPNPRIPRNLRRLRYSTDPVCSRSVPDAKTSGAAPLIEIGEGTDV